MRAHTPLILSLLLAAACSSSEPKELGPLDMAVVGGQGQEDTVLVQLPEPITVIAGHRKDGGASLNLITGPAFAEGGTDTLVQNLTPIPGAIVNFVVTDPDCGRPFAGSALTDSTGRAKERWVLGNTAKPCVMEARLVDQATGAALIVDSIHATVLPGLAVAAKMNPDYVVGGTMWQPYTGFSYGQSIPLLQLVESITDTHGNVVSAPDLMYTIQDSIGRPDFDTWVWKPGPAVLDTTGTVRLYVKADSAVNFLWIRIPNP